MSQPYDRSFNFSAGPCVLPVPVLEEAKEDLLNYKGSGKSVMEMSHRSKDYEAIIAAAEQDFRTLAGVSDNYAVLFLQGGASLQFTMIANAFLGSGADYVTTGAWGQKAFEAAQMVGSANEVWSGKSTNFSRVPDKGEVSASAGASFIYYTSNETIQGVQYNDIPDWGAPLVCDMSSDILSKPIDLSKYALAYAGAQKNMGPAGVVVVVIEKSFLEKAPAKTHPMLDYRLMNSNGSMYNTPPCWSIYMCGLNYKYMLNNGGLKAAEERNRSKAKWIYDAIDNNSEVFEGHARVSDRSMMNITFRIKNADLEADFFAGAKALRLEELKGHRSVGGARASVYNAFPEEGCKVLAEYMADFARRNG